MSRAPCRTFRHNGVSVAVWRRLHDGKSFFSVKVQQSYKDENQVWQNSEYVNFDRVPTLGFLLQRAYGYISGELEKEAKTLPAANTSAPSGDHSTPDGEPATAERPDPNEPSGTDKPCF